MWGFSVTGFVNKYWHGNRADFGVIKKGCSRDRGLPGCKLPLFLWTQPGCHINASQSTKPAEEI